MQYLLVEYPDDYNMAPLAHPIADMPPERVQERLRIGCTITPLVLASPRRVAALQYAIERADFSERSGPEVLAVLDAMLKEMKGATDE